MADFTPIETQEEFDALIKDRIERAQKTVRKEYADYDDVKTQLGAAQEENKKLTDSVATLNGQIKDLNAKLRKSETDSAKTRIALEAGLPIEMADRLSGENPDELKEDAKALAGLFSRANTPPRFSPEAKPEESGRLAMKGLLDKIRESE